MEQQSIFIEDTKNTNFGSVFAILKMFWKKIWILAIGAVVGVVIGSIVFSATEIPLYSSTIMMYVNTSSVSVGGTSFSLSTGNISTSRQLVKTLGVILKNSTVLEEVIDELGLYYSPEALAGMISTGAAEDTEILCVTVTTANAEEAALIADKISEIFPIEVAETIEGASVRVVKKAKVNPYKVSESATKDVAVGFGAGVVLACIVVLILEMNNNVIEDTNYLINSYKVPILGEVPNLNSEKSKSYYKSGYKYGYYKKKRSTVKGWHPAKQMRKGK